MGAVDHQPFRHARFFDQSREDPVEHSEAALPDEPIVERFVGAVARWRILPLQAVADHVDDPADDTTIVNPGGPARTREMRSEPLHLSIAKQNQTGHRTPPIPYESHRAEPGDGS